MTFRTRSFVTALVTAAVTLAVAVVMVSWSVRRTAAARIERALVDQARLAAETLSHRRPGTPGELDAEADALGRLVAARITFIGPDGAVVGDSELTPASLATVENHGDRPEVQQARGDGIGIARRFSSTVGTEMLYVAVPVRNPAIPSLAHVRLALPLTDIRDQLSWVRRSAIIAAAIGLVTALALAWTASSLLSRRVHAIAAVARRYAAGDFSQSVRDYGADEIGTVARVLDDSIRDLKRRAADLDADRARMEAILAGMSEGVLVVNAQGLLQLVNPAARRMLRLADGAAGRHYLEIVRHPGIAAQVTATLRGERSEAFELTLQRDLVIIVRTTPFAAGALRGTVVVLHEITDLRRADRVRRDFVANVSHELRTPLTAVRGYVEALMDGTADALESRRFLEIIASHTLRMERLVRDLLRLARLDAGQEQLQPVSCDVERLLAGVEDDMAELLRSRGQRVVRQVAPEASTVRGDPEKLHDAVRNLLENASHYSPEGCTITMSAVRNGETVCLSVADEGQGIPEADLTRVFERFYRVDKARARDGRNSGGTGLGLSIVKHLVELHGGRVTVANRPDGGALFTIDLPQR